MTTGRPRSVGSFFISRSSEGSKLRRREQALDVVAGRGRAIERRCRLRGVWRAEVLAHRPDFQPSGFSSKVGDEQDAVDLVHLDELHLDALAAGGRQVLAHVVGADRQLAVPAVGEHGELDARGRP